MTLVLLAVAALVAQLADLASFALVRTLTPLALDGNPLANALGLGEVAVAKLVGASVVVVVALVVLRSPRGRRAVLGATLGLGLIGAVSNLVAVAAL